MQARRPVAEAIANFALHPLCPEASRMAPSVPSACLAHTLCPTQEGRCWMPHRFLIAVLGLLAISTSVSWVPGTTAQTRQVPQAPSSGPKSTQAAAIDALARQ